MKTGRLNLSDQSPFILKEGTLYELEVRKINLITNLDRIFSFPEALKNGRSSYIIFEDLIRELTNLQKIPHFDHGDEFGNVYEQKSYKDKQLHPNAKSEFQCIASSTFGANNNGPKIKNMLKRGNYSGALKICKDLGYDNIDYFIFTNTSQWNPRIPFRFFLVSKQNVLRSLSKSDPRLVCRDRLMAMIRRRTLLV